MDYDNYKKVEAYAKYLIKNNCTIRATATVFGVSKSSVHYELSKNLKTANSRLYLKVKKILDNNFMVKHIRGGEATRKKYLLINNNGKK